MNSNVIRLIRSRIDKLMGPPEIPNTGVKRLSSREWTQRQSRPVAVAPHYGPGCLMVGEPLSEEDFAKEAEQFQQHIARQLEELKISDGINSRDN